MDRKKIPTVTLELKTTKENKVLEYWAQFKPALIKAITTNFYLVQNNFYETSTIRKL